MDKSIINLVAQFLYDNHKNKIFSVTFVKKDGTIRTIVARLNANCHHLEGGNLLSYSPVDYGMMVVFDMNKKAYRTINLQTIKRLKLNGMEYNNYGIK